MWAFLYVFLLVCACVLMRVKEKQFSDAVVVSGRSGNSAAPEAEY